MDRLMSDQVIPKSLRSPLRLAAHPSKVRIWSQELRRNSLTASVIALTRLTYTSFDVKELNRLLRRSASLRFRFGSQLVLGTVIRATIDRL
jgi:hypothetical protein